jgi:zinc protease
MRLILVWPVLALCGSVAQAQWAPNDTMPTDTTFTIGTLPNGLRYYIRHNAKPAHRAEFRLIVRVGSLMETPDQLGVAHFVEHMAFRGTAHFSGSALVDYLQSIGVKFGADLNAETSFDHTMYSLSIPTDTLAQLRTGVEIMEDWAHGVAFRQADIDDERGIILGERRSGLGAGRRIQDQQLPVLLKGSRYPDRLPIGTLGSVEHMTRTQLVQFYTTWYRPDRMAVVAVGDFDPAMMANLIRTAFDAIPTPATPRADPVFPIPPQPGTLVSVVRDPEVSATSINVVYKGPAYPRFTVAALHADVVRSVFDGMINQRFADMLRKPDVPFLSASVGHGILMTPAVSTVEIDASMPDSGVVSGLVAVLAEVARVDQHGFSAAELARALDDRRTAVDNADARRHDRQSGEFVASCVGNFLVGTRIVSEETAAAWDRHAMSTLTLAAVDSQASFWTGDSNRVVLVVQPQTSTVPPVDTARLLAVWPAVAARTQAAEDTAGATVASPSLASPSVLDNPPTPGTIVAERQYPTIGVTRWTLSNGVQVLIKATTFEPDQVLMVASKTGGWSVLGDSVYPAVTLAQSVANVSSLGRFSQLELGRVLAGKAVQVSASVGTTAEYVSGSARVADLETMLQLAHLMLTDVRYDSASTRAMVQQARGELANRSLSPGAVFGDSISVTLSRHSPRAPIPSVALLDQIDPRQALSIYRDRFADANGFTFLFVGTIDTTALRPLVMRYLGSLPDLHRREAVVDRPVFHSPPGVVHRTVVAGEEAKTETVLRFTGPYTSTRQSSADLIVLTDVLQDRLRNRLREQLRGTYTVGVASDREPAPINEQAVLIQFTAEPAHRTELIRATFAVIDSLKRTGPTAAELKQVRAIRSRGAAQARETNGYWLGLLTLDALGRPLEDSIDDSELRAMTPTRVRAAAERYLDLRQYEEFDLVPVSGTPMGAP